MVPKALIAADTPSTMLLESQSRLGKWTAHNPPNAFRNVVTGVDELLTCVKSVVESVSGRKTASIT